MATIAVGKWFLVVFLSSRMEAFDMGAQIGAYEKCQDIIVASANRKEVELPARLAELLQLEYVEELGCIDGDTVAELATGKFGKKRLSIENIYQGKDTQKEGAVERMFKAPTVEEDNSGEPLVKYRF